MDILAPAEAEKALAQLLAGDGYSLSQTLGDALAPHFGMRSPEDLAKDAALQIIAICPDKLLCLIGNYDTALLLPHRTTLSIALHSAFISRNADIPAHTFNNVLTRLAISPETIEDCHALFTRKSGHDGASSYENVRKIALFRCRQHWTFEQLIESGLSAEQLGAAKIFLHAGQELYPREPSFSQCAATLSQLIQEETPQALLAIEWLCTLRDTEWGEKHCKPLLAHAGALQETLLLHPCASGRPLKTTKPCL